MAVRTYNVADVVLTIGGTDISGFGDGTIISVEREEQSFEKYVGAEGSVSRSKTNNKSGSLTITLAQTSPSNQFLSALAKRDELESDGVVPVSIKDNSGNTKLVSASGWVQGLPTIEFAKEISEREWVLDLANIEFNIAGNTSNTGADFTPSNGE